MIATLTVAALAWLNPMWRPGTATADAGARRVSHAELADEDFKASLTQMGFANELRLPAHTKETWRTVEVPVGSSGIEELGFARELLVRYSQPARTIGVPLTPKAARAVKLELPDLSSATARVLTTPVGRARVLTTPAPARRR